MTLTSARAMQLEARLRDLIAEYADSASTEQSARRFGVLGVVAPLLPKDGT